jgi:hypothetical protein
MVTSKVKKGKVERGEVAVSGESEPSIIIGFEKVIRYFIMEELKSFLGDKWFRQGIPKELRTQWQERKADDERAGRLAEENLINYADFSDYKVIILQNWTNVFSRFFRDKEQTRVRFDDLNYFRKSVMHSRTLSNDETGHAKITIKWITNRISSVGEGWTEKIIAFKKKEEKEKGYRFGLSLVETIVDQLDYPKIRGVIKMVKDSIGTSTYDGENAYEHYIEALTDELDELGANIVLYPKEWFTDNLEWTEENYKKEKEKFEKNAQKKGSLAWIIKLASDEKDFPSFDCSDEFLGEMFRAIHGFFIGLRGKDVT